MKGVKLEQNKEISKDHFMIYNKPKYIYIPLIMGNDTDLTVLVKKDDYVCKGEPVARRKGNLLIPIHSSVSGTVIDFEEKLYQNGNYVKCIKIENDFKERTVEKEARKDISKISKEEFLTTIKDAGIVGMGGAGFPTYIKYQVDSIKTLIINAVECEPYITADYALGIQKAEEILETIDAIMEINHISKAVIAMKKNNTNLINTFETLIGTYANIELVTVPNRYPFGWEKALVEYVTKESYQRLPIEVGVVVNNISTIYAIYQALKFNKPLMERIITITGDMIKQPTNVLVKIGTPTSELVEAIGGMKRNKDVVCIAGGPMMGESLPNHDMIVTATTNTLIILKEKPDWIEQTCMRCGKCVQVCPAGIAPVLIKDAYLEKEALQDLQVNKCVECGLCSYICPAKIKVREYVRRAKKTLREEESHERIS